MNEMAEGTIIENESLQILEFRYVSTVNQFQMKLMKVIYKTRNIMIQDFQHSVELKLIQVMIVDRQMIQSESIVNLIQMKLIIMIYNQKT
jgi:hypothetical protein